MTEYTVGNNPCPQCRLNGEDESGDNFHYYGEGRGGHCFACGYTELSDDEKEARGIGVFEWQEELMSDREPITQSQIDRVKSTTGTQGFGHRNITDETYSTYATRFEYDVSNNILKHYYPVTENYNPSGFKIRILPKDFSVVGKYGSDSDLFGQWKFRNSNSRNVVITAGEVDCLSAFQMLEDYRKSRDSNFEPIPVVSPLIGEKSAASQLQKQYEWLNRFDKIIVCFDNDTTGRAAWDDIVKVLPKGKMHVMELPLKDTNEMLKQGHQSAWINAYFKARPFVPDGILPSSELGRAIRDVIRIPKIPLPPFMYKLQSFMAGGIPLGRIVNVASASGTGKCHGKGTPILMYDMTKKPVEKVVVGDRVMGDDGTPRTVLNTTSGVDELFLVKQLKGEDYVVNSNHVLSLKSNKTAPSRGFIKDDVVNINVLDFINLPKTYKESVLKGYNADLLNLNRGQRDVDDAYFIGLWLADGTSAKPQVTVNNNDVEIVTFINNYAVKKGYRINISPSNIRKSCTAYDYAGGCKVWLREEGVLGNKHIPLTWLASDYTTRLNLLAGILDGDGHANINGYELTMKNDQLALDIVTLARSVGLKVSVKDKFSKCQNFDGAIYKRLHICGNTEKVPNRLSRKKSSPRLQIKDPLRTSITVESIGEGEYYGFEVDGNHLYCLGDFTVTHNSTFCDEMVYFWILNSPHRVGVVSLEAEAGEYGINVLSRHVSRKINLIESVDEKIEFLESEYVKQKERELWIKEDGTPRWHVVDDRDGGIDSIKRIIENLIIQCDCKVIVIDPLQDLLDGLSVEDQAIFMKWQKGMVKSHRVTFININHLRKSGTGQVAGSQGGGASEEDFQGSSAIFKSAACNILFSRNKEAEDDIERNTTYMKMPKCRWTGVTGIVGEFYYDNTTHTLHDKEEWLKENPIEVEDEF